MAQMSSTGIKMHNFFRREFKEHGIFSSIFKRQIKKSVKLCAHLGEDQMLIKRRFAGESWEFRSLL